MAKFPTAIDDASSLYSPVDAFSSKPLETTATAAIGAADSTISVAKTWGTGTSPDEVSGPKPGIAPPPCMND